MVSRAQVTFEMSALEIGCTSTPLSDAQCATSIKPTLSSVFGTLRNNSVLLPHLERVDGKLKVRRRILQASKYVQISLHDDVD